MEEELKKIEAEMWQFWAPVDAAIDALSGADQHDVFPTKKGGRVLSPTPDTAAAWLAKWALEPRGGLFKSKKAKLHDVLTAFVNNPSASAAVKSFLNRSEALESQKAKQ